MTDILYYVVLGLILMTYIFHIILYKKISLVKLLVFVLLLSMVVIWEFFTDLLKGIQFDYLVIVYEVILLLGLMFFCLTFRTKIKVTKNLTDHDFFELEKEVTRLSNQSELLRKRFISSIEILNEGLIFYETDLSGLYMTDQIKGLIDLRQNQISFDDYIALIHDDDRKGYLQTIRKVNERVPIYEIKYRIKSKETYAWIIERGKMFKHEKLDHIISTFKPVNLKLYPETMIDELDSLPSEDELIKTLSILRKDKETFYLAMFHLTNIPDVNKRFGRDVGNLMIAEYIKNMRYHFAREKNTLFRITGIQFAMVIKDDLKYQNLYRALSSGGDLINLKLSIGGIQQIIYPNLGIIKNDPWSKLNVNDIISLSHKALEEAISDQKNNFSIIGG